MNYGMISIFIPSIMVLFFGIGLGVSLNFKRKQAYRTSIWIIVAGVVGIMIFMIVSAFETQNNYY